MDEARLDWRRRARIVDVMDRITRRAGDYLLLADLVERCLPPAGSRPAVVLDIASGPAGFPLAVARTVGRRRRCTSWPGTSTAATWISGASGSSAPT